MSDKLKAYGKIIIITAPSGSGKTSIVKHLLQRFPMLSFSISATTRQPRENEKDGVDYYFLSRQEFEKKIHAKQFLEWEMVYEGKYYGTLKSEMERLWEQQQTPVLDVDVKGAIHVMQQYPVNTISIFIQAPSLEILKNRLVGRGTESEESLKARMDKSAYELTFRKNFQNVIVNDNFEEACSKVDEIVERFLQIP